MGTAPSVMRSLKVYASYDEHQSMTVSCGLCIAYFAEAETACQPVGTSTAEP